MKGNTMSVITTGSGIRTHFWNLAHYVSGELIGDWVELDDCIDLDDYRDKVREVTHNAEEILMGDSENEFGISFSEYQSLETTWAVHEAVSEISEDDRQAFGEYLAHLGGVEYLDQAVSGWQDAYRGNFDSMDDYARHMLEELYPEFLASVPDGFRIDVDTIAWESDHWISDSGNVFSYI